MLTQPLHKSLIPEGRYHIALAKFRIATKQEMKFAEMGKIVYRDLYAPSSSPFIQNPPKTRKNKPLIGLGRISRIRFLQN